MENGKQKAYSLGYFDLARGLAILFVIAGHSMALFLNGLPHMTVPPVFAGAGRVLGGGLMAMFFMISGFYFYRRSPMKCIKTQTKLLLKPYWMTGIAIFLCEAIRYLINGKSFQKEAVRLALTYFFGFNALHGETFLGHRIGTVSMFWFLLALLGGWILLNWISWLKSKTLRVLCILSCVVLSWQLSRISSVWPLAIPPALLAVGYLATGCSIRTYGLLDKKLPWYVWLAISIPALLCLAFGYVDIAPGVWKLGLLDVVGSFCIGFLLMRGYAKLMDLGLDTIKFTVIDYVGLHAIRTLCLHALEKAVIPWQSLDEIFPNQPLLCMLLCFTGRILIIGLLFLLINKIRRVIRKYNRQKITLTDD